MTSEQGTGANFPRSAGGLLATACVASLLRRRLEQIVRGVLLRIGRSLNEPESETPRRKLRTERAIWILHIKYGSSNI